MADEIGFPLMIKATAGGGGRGMRLAQEEKDFIKLLRAAQAEAEAAFGNGACYIERYVVNPRHIEFQVRARSRCSRRLAAGPGLNEPRSRFLGGICVAADVTTQDACRTPPQTQTTGAVQRLGPGRHLPVPANVAMFRHRLPAPLRNVGAACFLCWLLVGRYCGVVLWCICQVACPG